MGGEYEFCVGLMGSLAAQASFWVVPLPPGCTHFIIGRDMAGCKSSISGNDFYGAYDAQELLMKHSAELGVQVRGQRVASKYEDVVLPPRFLEDICME